MKRIISLIIIISSAFSLVTPSVDAAPTVIYKGSSTLQNGKNVFFGTFLYNGAKYGFTLSMNYSASTGKISNIIYEADGYGSGSKISSGKITSDGNTLIIEGKASGTYCYIKASRKSASIFKGKMIRGNHSGTCTLVLQ